MGIPVYLILQRSSKLSSIIREGAVETKKLIAAVRRGGIITWSAIARKSLNTWAPRKCQLIPQLIVFAIIENAVAIYRKDTGAETQQICVEVVFSCLISILSNTIGFSSCCARLEYVATLLFTFLEN